MIACKCFLHTAARPLRLNGQVYAYSPSKCHGDAKCRKGWHSKRLSQIGAAALPNEAACLAVPCGKTTRYAPKGAGRQVRYDDLSHGCVVVVRARWRGNSGTPSPRQLVDASAGRRSTPRRNKLGSSYYSHYPVAAYVPRLHMHMTWSLVQLQGTRALPVPRQWKLHNSLELERVQVRHVRGYVGPIGA